MRPSVVWAKSSDCEGKEARPHLLLNHIHKMLWVRTSDTSYENSARPHFFWSLRSASRGEPVTTAHVHFWQSQAFSNTFMRCNLINEFNGSIPAPTHHVSIYFLSSAIFWFSYLCLAAAELFEKGRATLEKFP